MEKNTKWVLVGVGVIIIIIVLVGLFYPGQKEAMVQNESNDRVYVSVTVTTTALPKVTPEIIPTTAETTACNLVVIPWSKWNALNSMSPKRITDNLVFFNNQNKAAEGIMQSKIEGSKGREVSALSGKFEQIIFSMDGKINIACNVWLSYPSTEIDPSIKADLWTTDNPRELSGSIQVVRFHTKENVIVAGWSKKLNVFYISGGDSGDSSSGDSSSGGGSGGGPGPDPL